MRKPRQKYGNWTLYFGKPKALGCKPRGSSGIYYIDLSMCQTPETREKWITYILSKSDISPDGYDIAGLRGAFADLVKKGILKP